MSLRTRLIISYTLIVVLCLGIVAIAVSVMLPGDRDRFVMASLENMVRPISVQFRSLTVREQLSPASAWSNLEEQARKNDVYILLVSGDGTILRQAIPEGGSKEQFSDLAKGDLPHGITEPGQGTLTTDGGQTFIFAAYPVGRLLDAEKQPTTATLILTVPRAGSSVIWASMIRPFLFIGLIAFAVSVVIAFLLAGSVYRPVRQLTEATEKIARGQYDLAIPVSGPREIRGLAERFNEMASKVNQSQQQLRHFVADVSHQLKTPLTSIQGFAQAILDGTAGDSETRAKAIRVIDDESRRMIRQVDELLQLSRMQAGQIAIARELVDIKELLGHCLEIFSLRAEDNGISLKTEIEPLMPVVGDIDRLEQVFNNLIDNALKNSPARSEVSITGRNSGDGLIEVIVADSGPGIPPEQLPYVFERFYQASGLRSGVGLGLAIAAEIVSAHAGTIEVESNPGEGARFTVRLPASINRNG